MDWYAHIDSLGGDDYLVRVTAVSEEEGRRVNGTELIRFEHASDKGGTALRREVEKIAAAKLGALQ